MKVYAVFIRCSAPGYHCRWVDSQWAVEKAAEARMAEIDGVMVGCGVICHTTNVVTMEVVDVAIVPPAAPVKIPRSHKKKVAQ